MTREAIDDEHEEDVDELAPGGYGEAAAAAVRSILGLVGGGRFRVPGAADGPDSHAPIVTHRAVLLSGYAGCLPAAELCYPPNRSDCLVSFK